MTTYATSACHHLRLWVRIPLMTMCTTNMWYILSVTCGTSVVYSGYSGFLHQWQWPPRYNWNIVESGVNCHNFNYTPCSFDINCSSEQMTQKWRFWFNRMRVSLMTMNVFAVNRNNNCPFSMHDLSLGFYQRVTLRVSHGEQKLLTHLEAQRSPSVFSGLLFARPLVFYVVFCRYFFLFSFWSLYCPSFDLRICISPLVSSSFFNT
jgi:hypothetical protein